MRYIYHRERFRAERRRVFIRNAASRKVDGKRHHSQHLHQLAMLLFSTRMRCIFIFALVGECCAGGELGCGNLGWGWARGSLAHLGRHGGVSVGG